MLLQQILFPSLVSQLFPWDKFLWSMRAGARGHVNCVTLSGITHGISSRSIREHSSAAATDPVFLRVLPLDSMGRILWPLRTHRCRTIPPHKLLFSLFLQDSVAFLLVGATSSRFFPRS